MTDKILTGKNIITLTTDLGNKDYYSSILKGQILQIDPSINIIDITHSIQDFNLGEGSFIFKNAYPNFPENTIHFLAINTDRTDCTHFLVFKHKNQYFIGPDNGIFSLIFDEIPELIFAIPYLTDEMFPLKSIISKALRAILTNDFLQLGQPVKEFQKRIIFHPVTGNSMIRGSVIHIDGFENVIVNIHRELFEHIGENRDFEIYYKRWNPITKISNKYQDVPVGEIVAMFNSSNYLEIAVNMGKAATLLGLEIDDSIQIDFI